MGLTQLLQTPFMRPVPTGHRVQLSDVLSQLMHPVQATHGPVPPADQVPLLQLMHRPESSSVPGGHYVQIPVVTSHLEHVAHNLQLCDPPKENYF